MCSFNELILFGSHDNYLYCLDQKTGIMKWRYFLESTIFSSPALLNLKEANSQQPTIVCINTDGILFIFDLEGTLLTKRDLFNMKNSCFSSPIFFENTFVVGSRDNFVYSFELN